MSKRIDYYVIDRRLADCAFEFVKSKRLDKQTCFDNTVVRYLEGTYYLVHKNRIIAHKPNNADAVHAYDDSAMGKKLISAFANAENASAIEPGLCPYFEGRTTSPVELYDFKCSGLSRQDRIDRKTNPDRLAHLCLSQFSLALKGKDTVTIEYLNRVWAYCYGLFAETASESCRRVTDALSNFLSEKRLFLDENQFYSIASSVYNDIPLEQRLPKQKIFDMWTLPEKYREELIALVDDAQVWVTDKVKTVEFVDDWLFVSGKKFVKIKGDRENINAIVNAMEECYASIL